MIRRRAGGGGGGGGASEGTTLKDASGSNTTITTPTTTTPPNGKNISTTFVWRIVMMIFMVILVLLFFLQHQSTKPTPQQVTSGNVRGVANNDKKNKNKGDAAAQPPTQQRQDEGELLKAAPQLQESLHHLRQEFYQHYGGREAGEELLQRGVKTIGSLERAARQWLQLATSGEEAAAAWQLSFGGYSVTVGRGNFLGQSFPKVMERLLQTILPPAGPFPAVQVRNHAIGGIPSFPYGWCLSEFLGTDSHVVSWDYAMNEAKDLVALESYLRHALSLPHQPVFVMVDNMNKGRLQLLQRYYQDAPTGWSHAVVLAKADVAMGPLTRQLLAKEESQRPVGLQEWDKWGSPPGSPGQSSWHPKKKEHEMMGWMLTMHFVQVLEDALRLLTARTSNDESWLPTTDTTFALPKPVTPLQGPEATPLMSSLLYGVPRNNNDHGDQWQMNTISCRTSFLPTVRSPQQNLQSLVVSGLKMDDEDASSFNPVVDDRPASHYQGHWVADVGKVERDTKRKVLAVDPSGLGYIDRKVALYGIPASGTLQLQFPKGKKIKSVVICEVNEKRTAKECRMNVDVEYRWGGALVGNFISPALHVAEYLRKKICWVLPPPPPPIPPEAEPTLDITVTGTDVTLANGPCSISHVIWEEEDEEVAVS